MQSRTVIDIIGFYSPVTKSHGEVANNWLGLFTRIYRLISRTVFVIFEESE